MDKQEEQWNAFIETVEPQYRDFVNSLHKYFMQNGCNVQVKTAKSGYLISYTITKTKKTVANYIFRKKGLLIRIYANSVNGYMAFLDTLPEGMSNTIRKAPVCKRLLNPDDCNPRCLMGYDFNMNGEHYQKCRSSAFLFLLTEENNPYIKSFIENEMEARNKLC